MFVACVHLCSVCVAQTEERLAQLEMECELQRNVVKAALKLSADPAAPPNVAKQRKLFHKKVASKVRW